MAIDIKKIAEVGSMAATGGYTQAALGGLQAAYGLTQLPKAKAEFERAKASAPSLETPSQFYENYKNAYDSEIARMETDAIQSNLATSVQALQGAGGRALVGGLSGATRTAQDAQNRMLSQERAMRLQAGQQLATAQERSIGRKEARSQQEMAYANQAYQAALGNVAGGLGSLGEGLMYGLSNTSKKASSTAPNETNEKGISKEAINETEKLQKDLEMNDVDLQNIQSAEEASVLEDFTGNLAALEDDRNQAAAANAKAGIIPRVQTRLASRKAMRQTTFGDIGGVGTSSLPSKTAGQLAAQPSGYELPAINAPAPNVRQTAPVTGSAIPQYQQNEAVMNEIKQDSDLYNMVSPYLSGSKQITPAQKGWMKWYDKFGSYIPMMENGGMVTPGEFSHDSNPIDLVQNGEKIGEATGGEYVLNPKQAASIAKQSTYARKLFKKFEKNAKK